MAEATEAVHRVARLLDLTELKDDCTPADVDRLLARTRTPAGRVAAVCVWPQFVVQCRDALAGTGVRIATVVNFPQGGEDYAGQLALAGKAVAEGADEIDMVVSWRRADDREFIVRQVKDFRKASSGATLKAILETGEAANVGAIDRLSRAAIEGGADFIKTSTGKTPHGASLEAAAIMLRAIRDSSRPVGLKPSGGIRTLEDALAYLDLAAGIMGDGWVTPERFRFGASGLLDDLLARIGSITPASPPQGY